MFTSTDQKLKTKLSHSGNMKITEEETTNFTHHHRNHMDICVLHCSVSVTICAGEISVIL